VEREGSYRGKSCPLARSEGEKPSGESGNDSTRKRKSLCAFVEKNFRALARKKAGRTYRRKSKYDSSGGGVR